MTETKTLVHNGKAYVEYEAFRRLETSHDALVKALEAALIIAESAYHDDIEAGEKDAAEICLETVEQARAALAQAKGDA